MKPRQNEGSVNGLLPGLLRTSPFRGVTRGRLGRRECGLSRGPPPGPRVSDAPPAWLLDREVRPQKCADSKLFFLLDLLPFLGSGLEAYRPGPLGDR